LESNTDIIFTEKNKVSNKNLRVPKSKSKSRTRSKINSLLIYNLSEKDASQPMSLDTSKDITLGSLRREFVDITANSSIPNIEEDLDLDLIEEVSRTIRNKI
jgi:hypothetical protein